MKGGNPLSRQLKGSAQFRGASGERGFDLVRSDSKAIRRQLQIIEADNSQSNVGIYMYARRLYIVEGNVPGDFPPPALFQQSLGILDEDGELVVIEYDENDNPIRE